MEKRITIGGRGYAGFTNSAMQKAVDDLAIQEGGIVEVPAGIYLMRDALHLRSGVRVRGEKGAILRKVPSVASPLADFIGYGHYEFTVTEPDKFEPGMGILLTDSGAGGFYDTVATITGRKGNLFFIDRILNHDYHPAKGGTAATAHSLVECVSVRDAGVKDIVLDGNPDETREIGGCRGGGAYLLQAHNIELENLEILNIRGDGISFQQCTDLRITGCLVHDNLGGGIHPGSGSVRYEISENVVRGNRGYGIFYCLRTTHSLCRKNLVNDNGRPGISIGERDTDHVIRENTITGNGGQGIEFRAPHFHGGDRVVIEENRIEMNCRGEAEHEIGLDGAIHDVLITGNTIQPRKGKALHIGGGSSGVYFFDNTVAGAQQSKEDVCGEGEAVFRRPKTFPAVGPDAAEPGSARHLGIEKLT